MDQHPTHATTGLPALSPKHDQVEAFLGRMVQYMTGASVCVAVLLGDRLGLYRAMAGAGPLSADALAERRGCHPRLVREWLDANAAAGLVAFDAASDSYTLSDEGAMVLAVEDSPAFVAGGIGVVQAGFTDAHHIEHAFRGDGGFPWSGHHECLFKGTGRFFRPGYLNFLTSQWIPALDGVAARLTEGGRVADVGCGVGYSSELIARAFPRCAVRGFDYHQGSIEIARAERAGDLGERLRFDVATATSYEGRYDLVCFFDCLHDLGDPVGAAQYAREHLTEGGTVMLVEPFALATRAENHANPIAAMLYSASTFLCTPNSLSQEVGLALGAQSGESRMRTVFEAAGFRHFRRATETPFNIVYEARA